MVTYITGISGTGKTSIARELDKQGIASISIDEVDGLCAWVNKSTGKYVDYEAELTVDFIDKHKWVCDRGKLMKLIENAHGSVVVLGLADNYEELWDLFDKVLLLQASPEVFIKRIEQRSDNDFGKDPSAQKYLLSWYKEFEQGMIEKGAIVVNVEIPLHEVVYRIMEYLKKE